MKISRSVFFGLALLFVACAEPVADDDDTSLPDDDDDAADDDDDDAVGDDDDSASVDDDDAAPEALEVSCSAPVPSLDIAWDTPRTIDFTAEGRWSDGVVEDVTSTADWTIVGGPVGTIAAGTYTALGLGAGPATIEVEWEGVTGRCSIELFLEAVLDLTADPAIAAAVPGATTRNSDDCGPYVLYPLDGSLIPADFFSPEIQWIPGSGDNVFVITFETAYITVTAITQDPSWTPDGDEWWSIADPNSGANIDMSIHGGTWDGAGFTDGLCAAAWPTEFSTAEWGAQGSVFYWTPGSQGIWQVDVGAGTATPYMDQSVVGQCVGCHSVNYANPTLLAVTQGNGGYGASTIAWDTDPTAPVAGGGRTASFQALNETGTRVVRGDHGVLYLDDLTVDQNIGTVPTTGWATHPNWSADGQWLVYASCEGAGGGNDWNAHGCDLRIIEVLPNDQWGPDLSLAVAPPGQDYYYPTFSPDTQWVAFNRRSAGPEVYDEPTAELMIMPLSGGSPVVLGNANGLPNQTNSWPRWGPITGDIGWLAFGTRRPYAMQTSGIAQVWVSGVDLSLVAAGLDGSHAPVWLPGQSTTTGNHTPAFVQRATD